MSRFKNPNANRWIGNDKLGVWEYYDYRSCYLTIRRLDNGMFKPMIGASGNLDTPFTPLPKIGYQQFEKLEDSKCFLFKYVDYLRDVWDIKAKDTFNRNLHYIAPNVFPL